MVNWFRRKPRQRRPEVSFTPTAHQQLEAVMARQPQPAALRILVKNPGGAPPQFDMALEPAGALQRGDTLIDVGGLQVVVDVSSLSAVDGATVDFRNDPLQPGFVIQPVPPPQIGVPDAFDISSALATEVQSVLVHQVNPSIAVHGGSAQLVGVKDDVVFVSLGGGCQGCSMASVTLKQGIEQILKQAIPRIRAVVDATDHAHGTEPFYTAAKGGESALHNHDHDHQRAGV